MQYERQDTDVVVSLPKNYQGFFTSKFRADKIEQVSHNKQRLWIEDSRIFRRRYWDKKNSVLEFFVQKTKANTEIKHETHKKK